MGQVLECLARTSRGDSGSGFKGFPSRRSSPHNCGDDCGQLRVTGESRALWCGAGEGPASRRRRRQDSSGEPEISATVAFRRSDDWQASSSFGQTYGVGSDLAQSAGQESRLIVVREGLAAVLRVRADLDLQSALPGGAATSALTALSLVRSSPSGQSSRALVRTLATVVTVACTTGDVELARRCAREALVTAQAALGPEDPDTAAAWQSMSQALEAAGDQVAARAAGRQAETIRR